VGVGESSAVAVGGWVGGWFLVWVCGWMCGVFVCECVHVWGGEFVCGCRCGKKYVGLFLMWQHSTQPSLAGYSPTDSLGLKFPVCIVWVKLLNSWELYTVRTIYHAAKILFLGGAASSHPLKYINS